MPVKSRSRVTASRRGIEFDLATKRHGNSAALCLESEKTRVVTGGLHTEVLFKDLGITVILNPNEPEDQWGNETWARATAWKAMIAAVRPEDLELLLKIVRSVGMDEGAREARRQVRHALGISDRSGDNQ